MRCNLERYQAACNSRQPRHDIPAPDCPCGMKHTAEEYEAARYGRNWWLDGFEEPEPDMYLRMDRQTIYEDNYYAEIYDCVTAVNAYTREAKRCGYSKS